MYMTVNVVLEVMLLHPQFTIICIVIDAPFYVLNHTLHIYL